MSLKINQLSEKLKKKFPELHFEIIDFDEIEALFYIAVISSGPDYAPDLQAVLPPNWIFSGWTNPDLRNNIATVRWFDQER